MFARQVEHYGQIGQAFACDAVAAAHGKSHFAVIGLHVDGANLGIFRHAVSGNGASHHGQDVAQGGAVYAQHGVAIKRHAVQKIDKGFFQAAKVVPVGFHMVGVDVGDYGHNWQELEEGCIRFVCFNYDVLAHTDLSRTKGESLGLRLDRINWGNYDLVVIDESHNFRNADYAEEKESRYQRLMRQIIREGVKTKVLMLSATPVNNRFNDLKTQLALAYEGDPENLSKKLKTKRSIEDIFRRAQTAFNNWTRLPPEERTARAILENLDFDFFELLDSVTIARSRKHIETFYDTKDIGPPSALFS